MLFACLINEAVVSPLLINRLLHYVTLRRLAAVKRDVHYTLSALTVGLNCKSKSQKVALSSVMVLAHLLHLRIWAI